jgi:AmiR/NasT family two-component response regulator
MRKNANYPVRVAREPHPLREFEGLDVVLATELDDQGALLLRELQRLRVRAHHLWPAPELLPSEGDVIYCDYVPHLPRRLPWEPGAAKLALVVLLPQSGPIEFDALTLSAPDAVLARPFTPLAVQASLAMARSQFCYEQRLRIKLDKLDENLRMMRTVERAKSILMATRHIADDEAYELIRSQAMDKRTSVSSVAAAVVSSYELLGPGLK